MKSIRYKYSNKLFKSIYFKHYISIYILIVYWNLSYLIDNKNLLLHTLGLKVFFETDNN